MVNPVSNPRPARDNAYSYIRALSCFAIVLLHTVFCAVSLFADDTSDAQYVLSNLLDNNLMWAVPCFLMVSGALLLDPAREMSIGKIFRKYISRLLIALVAFCVLFRVLEVIVYRETVTLPLVLDGLYEIWSGQSWSHVWYLYLMIGIYLLLPFYRMIAAQATDAQLRYLLAVYLVFLSLMPILGIWDVENGFYIHVSTIYPFHFFCGRALKSGALKVSRRLAALLLLAGTAGISVFSLLFDLTDVYGVDIFFGYNSIFVVLQAAGVFSLFAPHRKEAAPAAKTPGLCVKAVLCFDGCSFGVYLIHMIFVRGVFKHTPIQPYAPGSWLILLGVTVGITLVSWLCTWLLKKIPGVKEIL